MFRSREVQKSPNLDMEVGNHASLTHRIMFRSREVQISPEPEKEASGNYELEQIPAFDAIQVFKKML